jgi:hypothetical protein
MRRTVYRVSGLLRLLLSGSDYARNLGQLHANCDHEPMSRTVCE